MEQLTKLLELSVAEATFDAGHITMPREGVSISYASRAQDIATPEQLLEMFGTRGWEAENYHRASSAQLVIRDDLFSEVEHQVRSLLQDSIDPSMDRIGHAFPTGVINDNNALPHPNRYSTKVVASAKMLPEIREAATWTKFPLAAPLVGSPSGQSTLL